MKCKCCGKDFESIYPTAIYCSRECHDDYERTTLSEQARLYETDVTTGDGMVRFVIESDVELTADQVVRIADSAHEKPVWWSDQGCYHFIMSYQFEGLWVDSTEITDGCREYRLMVAKA